MPGSRCSRAPHDHFAAGVLTLPVWARATQRNVQEASDRSLDMRLPFLTALCLAIPTSCATTEGGGLFPSDDYHEVKARAAITERSKFDLECDQVELTRISDVTRLGQQMTSMSFGARGCEKKATYYVECVSNMGNVTCNPTLNSKE